MAEDMTLLEAVLLGVVQGLTEWLPISSSGHLVLGQALLGVEAPVFFDLVLHLGTLLVVIVYFRRVLLDVVRAVIATPREVARHGWRRAMEHPARRLAALVVLGTIPTAVIGFTFRDTIVALFESTLAVGLALLTTGTLLWLTRRAPERQSPLTWRKAVIVGTAQGVAILPGISRSGSTIAVARLLGVGPETAVQYSFLLAIPAILGAAILQTTPEAVADARGDPLAYLAGTAAAIVVGFATLHFLVLLVRRQMLHWFAFYCWALGGVALAWTFLGAP